jgi:hypothetical protein
MAFKIEDMLGGAVIPTAGGGKVKVCKLTADNAYATGGYAVTAAQFGLTAITAISDALVVGKFLHYDPATAKVQVLVCGASGAAAAEAANASDQSLVAGGIVTVIGT